MRIAIIALLATSASAFMSPSLKKATALHASTTSMEKILTSAEECMDTECSVEDVKLLIDDLEKEKNGLEKKSKQVQKLIGDLKKFNKMEKKDEGGLFSWFKPSEYDPNLTYDQDYQRNKFGRDIMVALSPTGEEFFRRYWEPDAPKPRKTWPVKNDLWYDKGPFDGYQVFKPAPPVKEDK